MITEPLKNATHEPAHDTVIHSYDPTELHTCIDGNCPHRGHIVHYLGMFGAMWIDDAGQIHNHCELKPLLKPRKTKTPRALQIRATELDGTRTRTFLTKAGAEQLKAMYERREEEQRLQETRDLPKWMLTPCPLSQIPIQCLLGLDKCSDAKFCRKQRLAEYARRNRK